MTSKQIVFSAVLVGFSPQTAFVLYEYGLGWIPMVFENAVNLTIFTDLVICLSLMIAWLVVDARERGLTWWPYLVLTLGFGSVGPLVYLIRRESAGAERSAPARA